MTNWAGKTPTTDEWRDILENHAQWYRGEAGGCRANLRSANLSIANLRDANLSSANLRDANLSIANLRDANLSSANLRDANLSGANLRDANLSSANLSSANLRDANLRDANLRGANLRGANLRGADLSGADLDGADLRSANLLRLVALRRICPESGAFTAFKKLHGGVIAELLIPADAARVGGLIGRKCRAAFADVVSLSAEGPAVSTHDRSFAYVAGQRVTPREPFSDDPRIECASGIHFFMSRLEAEEYNG